MCLACCKFSKSNDYDKNDNDDDDIIEEETATTEKGHNFSNAEYVDSSYGKTWMFFPDGNGVPQVAYLTEPPSRKADPKAGNIIDKVRFDLYTRYFYFCLFIIFIHICWWFFFLYVYYFLNLYRRKR